MTTTDSTDVVVTEQPKHFKPRHPYQVLRALPKDATPAQQDSAIQATFQPKEVRYSNRPDTLHLPGYGKGKSALEVTPLPKYYKESFFANDTLFHPERSGGRYGVAGDTVPYTVRGDNAMTIILLMGFISMIISASESRRFIIKQLKSIFYLPKYFDTALSETSSELRFQLFMVALTSLLYAVIILYYSTRYISDTFIIDSHYQLTGIFLGLTLGYFIFKAIIYTIVNWTFFGVKRNLHWLKALLFLVSSEGMLLFPVVLLLSYFNLNVKTALIITSIILILVKTVTFYKSYVIFFRRKSLFLQNILYFCALEIVPLVSFGGLAATAINVLKINF